MHSGSELNSASPESDSQRVRQLFDSVSAGAVASDYIVRTSESETMPPNPHTPHPLAPSTPAALPVLATPEPFSSGGEAAGAKHSRRVHGREERLMSVRTPPRQKRKRAHSSADLEGDHQSAVAGALLNRDGDYGRWKQQRSETHSVASSLASMSAILAANRRPM
eukprot:Opistho-2@17942